jgi:2-keto-3-deoxy-6-phosphogluconate aldolase
LGAGTVLNATHLAQAHAPRAAIAAGDWDGIRERAKAAALAAAEARAKGASR